VRVVGALTAAGGQVCLRTHVYQTRSFCYNQAQLSLIHEISFHRDTTLHYECLPGTLQWT
jgi:hypothetical protein